MSATPRKARRSRHSLRLWAFEQAQAAVPYLKSIVRSLREHALDIQRLHQQAQTLDELPGRPSRQTLIQLQETRRDLQRAEDEFAAAQAELEALDVQLLDAIKGQVLVPFYHNDQLAWFIFDANDSPPIRSWRYQSDPEETRRKLTPAQMR